jgi:hypothetical protein
MISKPNSRSKLTEEAPEDGPKAPRGEQVNQPKSNVCSLLPNKPEIILEPGAKKPLVIGSYRVTKTLG